MIFLRNLRHRICVPEIMDDHSLDAQEHVKALQGLERINWWSQSLSILWEPIRLHLKKTRSSSLKILDIATGAGDLPILLWQKARQAGIDLQVEACDSNPRSVQYAHNQAHRLGVPVRFFETDVVKSSVPIGYDLLMSSLFLHHLANDDALLFLKRMRSSAGRLILINDLIRSRRGLVMASVGTQLLSRSDVVHADGPRSVRSAYTLKEIKKLSTEAGLTNSQLFSRWPCRFLLVWEKES